MKTLIVVIVLIGLSSVAASIIVGSRVFDGTVTQTPYETGLLWDQMQKEREASGLSITITNAEFTEGTNTLLMKVLDQGGKPLRRASISVTVSRPSTASYDKTYNCAKLDDGSWRAVLAFPLYGYWDLKVRIVRGQSDILFAKQVFAKK